MSEFDTVVGLEVHVQLSTATKAFSADTNRFGSNPNTNVHPTSIALPGALPRANTKHVLYAAKLGLALESTISEVSFFDRKHYFYPDSPKGFQITQDELPIVVGGQFTFTSGDKERTIRIHHVHMEDDAGKSIHDLSDSHTYIDLNRAGTPLLEVVTEPDFRSGQEVHDFLAAFRSLLRYLDISDANMEEGSMRCDCNVSVKKSGTETLGTRCEIKNINSKRFAKIAIEYEAQRQIDIIHSGKEVDQETRLFDADSMSTYTMRRKEDALDYRYFPEPDLQPIHISQETLTALAKDIDWLPWTARTALEKAGINKKQAEEIASQKAMVTSFFDLIENVKDPKLVAGFVINQMATRWEAISEDQQHLLPRWIELLTLIRDKKISASSAYQQLIPEIIKNNSIGVTLLAERHNLLISEASDGELSDFCKEILASFPDKVKAYQKGKKGLIGFFMGQAMRKNKAYDPGKVQTTFEELLK